MLHAATPPEPARGNGKHAETGDARRLERHSARVSTNNAMLRPHRKNVPAKRVSEVNLVVNSRREATRDPQPVASGPEQGAELLTVPSPRVKSEPEMVELSSSNHGGQTNTKTKRVLEVIVISDDEDERAPRAKQRSKKKPKLDREVMVISDDEEEAPRAEEKTCLKELWITEARAKADDMRNMTMEVDGELEALKAPIWHLEHYVGNEAVREVKQEHDALGGTLTARRAALRNLREGELCAACTKRQLDGNFDDVLHIANRIRYAGEELEERLPKLRARRRC